VRSEKYAVMTTTSKSMTPIARRKKPKDGSGMTALPLLLAFAIRSELQVGGLVPKRPRRKSQKLEMLPMLGDRAVGRQSDGRGFSSHSKAIFATRPPGNYEKNHEPLPVDRVRAPGTNV
jgi:hypothetical protein